VPTKAHPACSSSQCNGSAPGQKPALMIRPLNIEFDSIDITTCITDIGLSFPEAVLLCEINTALRCKKKSSWLWQYLPKTLLLAVTSLRNLITILM